MDETSNRGARVGAAAFARRAFTVGGAVVILAHCSPGESAGGRRVLAQTAGSSANGVEQATSAERGPPGVRATNASIERKTCQALGRPVALPGLPEASGVAASRRTTGLLWSLNDSGDPVLFAIDAKGMVTAPVRVTGADVTDWEAMALGPCPDGSCLFVADIGDNDARRRHITIYRVPEPNPEERATLPAEAFHATYPDGPHDAEALFVTTTGDLYVVTKGETGHIALYRFPQPLRAGSVVRLEQVTIIGVRATKKDRITDAGASPDGKWIALRTSGAVRFYRTDDLTSGRHRESLSFDVSELGERQGEGIALASGGTAYLVSEGGGKKRPGTLARIVCDLPQ
jgi:hypothetical protein